MPVLSRLRDLAADYRAAKAGVALLGGVGAALSPLSALAQDNKPDVRTAQLAVPAVKASFAKPPMPLGPHCDVIKAAFELVEFDGAYGKQATAWVNGKCHGDVPLPEPGRNTQRFNVASGVLSREFGVKLVP